MSKELYHLAGTSCTVGWFDKSEQGWYPDGGAMVISRWWSNGDIPMVQQWQTQQSKGAWERSHCKGKAGDRNPEKIPDRNVSLSKCILIHIRQCLWYPSLEVNLLMTFLPRLVHCLMVLINSSSTEQGGRDQDVKLTEIHGCIVQLKDCRRDTDQNCQT